jgi:hypothetical protein
VPNGCLSLATLILHVYASSRRVSRAGTSCASTRNGRSPQTTYRLTQQGCSTGRWRIPTCWLTAWFALEQKTNAPAERVAIFDAKVAALTEAQNAGRMGTALPGFPPHRRDEPGHGLIVASPFGASVNPRAAERPAALRKGRASCGNLGPHAGGDDRSGGALSW